MSTSSRQSGKPQTIPAFGLVEIVGPPIDLAIGSKAMMGISVKNRLFSAALVDKFCQLIRIYSLEAAIAIFDIPYAYNDAEDHGRREPSKDEIEKCMAIGNQRARMAQKVFSRYKDINVKLFRWHDLSQSDTYLTLRDEMREAARHSNDLRRLLIRQAKESIKTTLSVSTSTGEYIGFQLAEIPMLIYLYYGLRYSIDIYPGDNFQIFSQLEAGEWASVLPAATTLATRSRLTFVNCHPI